MNQGVRQRRRGQGNVQERDEPEDFRPVPQESTMSSIFAFFYIALLMLVIRYLLMMNRTLPPMLQDYDCKHCFIGARAERILLPLVNMGPKVTGSYNCHIGAVKFIKEEVAKIANESKPIHKMTMDLQNTKGDFYLAFKPYGFHSDYNEVQNLAVRLGPNPPSNHSVLVNCHYDTVPDSPGASDNGLNCAVMLEVMRVMSQWDKPFKHNVIFLFNGAEENVLQAAHGFITKHFWSSEVRAMINLDAAGAGGAETVFQASDDHPWLMEKYAIAAPHPSASMAAQEIFQMGLIPSDTDFRVFRDYGHIPGLDLAHADNGYIYHTKHDTTDYIEPGVYQHTGDNVLALLIELANCHEIENVNKHRNTQTMLVYYDLFGSVMVLYSSLTGSFLNIIAVLLTFFSAYITYLTLDRNNEGLHGFMVYISYSLFSVIVGVGAILCITFFLDKSGSTMSWYSYPGLILPLYVLPYIAGAVLPSTRFPYGTYENALGSFAAGQVLNAGFLLILTILGIRSSYLVMLFILFPALCGLFMRRFSTKGRLFVFAVSIMPGLINLLYNALKLYIVLIPVTGRMGALRNPELYIGGLTALVCFIAGNSVVPYFAMLHRPKFVFYAFMALHLTFHFLVAATPFGFPYTALTRPPAKQRFYVFHSLNQLYTINGTDARTRTGAFILPMDRNKMKYVSYFNPAFKTTAQPVDCTEGILCQFPVYNGRYVGLAKTAFYQKIGTPHILSHTRFNVLDYKRTSPFGRRMKFELIGPDHMTLVVSPREAVNISNWSLGEAPQASRYAGRMYYIIYISDSYNGNPRLYQMDLEAARNIPSLDGPWVDIMLVGHYQHDTMLYSRDFKALLAKFPEFAHVTSWLTSVQSHVF